MKAQLTRHKGKLVVKSSCYAQFDFLLLCGRDKVMEAHVSEKLSANEREMERLQTEERRIEKSLALKSERKKLRIF